jgi:hypothetical protein
LNIELSSLQELSQVYTRVLLTAIHVLRRINYASIYPPFDKEMYISLLRGEIAGKIIGPEN